MLSIREVQISDASRLAEIYSHYVRNTAVSFEYLTHDSSKFHICKGYTQVAHMKAVGKKFDRWYDLLWYQKRL